MCGFCVNCEGWRRAESCAEQLCYAVSWRSPGTKYHRNPKPGMLIFLNVYMLDW